MHRCGCRSLLTPALDRECDVRPVLVGAVDSSVEAAFPRVHLTGGAIQGRSIARGKESDANSMRRRERGSSIPASSTALSPVEQLDVTVSSASRREGAAP